MWQSHIPLSDLVHCGYPLLLGPPRAEREKKAGTRATPPKVGGHVTLDSGAEWHASIRPHAGRYRPHLSLREGSETGQIGAPKALVRVSLFPSPFG